MASDAFNADIAIKNGKIEKAPEGLSILVIDGAEAPADDGWSWAIVEIMGFRKHVGRIREVEQFGTKQLRVDVPIYRKTVDHPVAFDCWETHYYGGSAIFGITPIEEGAARKAAERECRIDPPTPLRLGSTFGHDDDNGHDDNAE